MLLGANLLFTEKKRGGIPSDCVEVEWIETDGSSYIKTDISANYSSILGVGESASIEMDVMFKTATSYALGTAGASPFYANSSRWRLCNVGAYSWYAWVNMTLNERKTLRWDVNISNAAGYNYQYIFVDGVQEASRGNTRQVAPEVAGEDSLYIGVFVDSLGNKVITPAGLRVYSLTQGINGELTDDLVPVRRVEGGVSVGYLCDRLTGQLYGNRGGGSFVIGPDKGLPYDAEVEWLQGDGVAFIDPHVDFSNESAKSILIDARATVLNGPQTGIIFGIAPRTGSAQGALRMRSTSSSFTVYPFALTPSYTVALNKADVSDGTPIEMRYLKEDELSHSCSVYGNTKTADANSTTSYLTFEGYTPILYGSKYKNTSGVISYGEIYNGQVVNFYLKNLRTGQMVDLIPVRKDGVGYFYDKISGQLFGNSASSGAFIIGPDK